jgi:CoA:oxalate CoA-transferase
VPTDADAAGPLPLSGIRILDLTRIYSGPYATFMLAMAGAEVIKVEPPGGESMRRRNANRGASLPFAMLNANKRAIVLDLKAPAGRRALLRLAATADVIVDNFRPGVMDRLGLGEAALRAVNPRLVIASTSGFGSSGPYRDYPAMDLTIQAISGVMASTGAPDQPPTKAGPAVGDFMAGAHLYGAIVTALLHRARHGQACRTEVAMNEALFPSLASNLAMAIGESSKAVLRTGNRHGGLALCPYNVYPAADGHVAIICNNETHWRALLGVLGRPELAEDPRCLTVRERVANMDHVDAEIARETARFAKEDLFEALNRAGVPCGPVRGLREVLADEQLHHTGMLSVIDHPEYGELVVPRSPIRFLDLPSAPYEASRALGADSAAILEGELGLDAEKAGGG